MEFLQILRFSFKYSRLESFLSFQYTKFFYHVCLSVRLIINRALIRNLRYLGIVRRLGIVR